MARRRMFLTGSERAEWEHIFGPLPVDAQDARFVLVDEETEEKIRKLPPGVPPRPSQDWAQVERIKEAFDEAYSKADESTESATEDVAGTTDTRGTQRAGARKK